jgi:diguanylate cyclase (GGDEF)-like protein
VLLARGVDSVGLLLPLRVFLVFPPLLAVAIVLTLRPLRGSSRRREVVLDAGLVFAAAVLFVLRFVTEPLLSSGGDLDALSAGLVQSSAIASFFALGLMLFWRQAALPVHAVGGLTAAAGLFTVGTVLAPAALSAAPAPPGLAFLGVWLAGWSAVAYAALAAGREPLTAAPAASGWMADTLRHIAIPGTVLVVGIVLVDAVLDPSMTLATASALGLVFGLLAWRIGRAILVAERLQAEQEVVSHARALVELSRALSGAPELRSTLGLIAAWTVKLTGARSAGIELLSEDRKTLKIEAVHGDIEQGRGLEFPVSDSFTGAVVRTGKRRVAERADEDPAFTPEGRELMGARPVAAVPLINRDRTLGALFATKNSEPFTDEQCQLLEALGQQAATAIQNARLYDEVRRSSLTDALTDLANRRHLMQHLTREFAAAARGRPLALVLFDVDGFKKFNDTRGHPAGDEALRALGHAMRQHTRAMNFAARLGGDEFAAVLSGTTPKGAAVFAERVRETFRAKARELGDPPLDISIGAAAFSSEMESHENLIAAADAALYRAKAGRKATAGEKDVAGAPPETREARGWDKALADAVPEAGVSGDFELLDRDPALGLAPGFKGDEEAAGG